MCRKIATDADRGNLEIRVVASSTNEHNLSLPIIGCRFLFFGNLLTVVSNRSVLELRCDGHFGWWYDVDHSSGEQVGELALQLCGQLAAL